MQASEPAGAGTPSRAQHATAGKPAVALQMYSVREQMAADALRTLSEVAAAGYEAIELVGYGNATVDAVAAEAARLGLRVLSAHIPYEELDVRLDEVIGELNAMSAEYLVVQQARPSDWASEESVTRLARQLNVWGAHCRSAGLALGYHGYHPVELEFAPLNGRVMYDLMAEETDPALVDLQVDTYWVHYVGRDPVDVLRRYAGRVPTLHLKDAAGDPPAGDTPVGDGVIAWRAVLGAAMAAGTRWLVVEQEDDPHNAIRDSARSLRYLQDLLMSLPSDEHHP